jgi:hypothetical protein
MSQQDEASGSFRLSYYDASDDQAWAPFFSYKLEAIYGATFSPWPRPRTISTSASTSSSVSMATFAYFLLPRSRGAAVWTLGVTAYVQRRVRTPPSDSLALYVVPNATYLPSADWVISLSLETWLRWYQGVPARPISRRDFEINPVLTIAYDPSTLFGGDSPLGSPQIALEIGFDTRSSNLVNKSFKQWTVGPVLSTKWKF